MVLLLGYFEFQVLKNRNCRLFCPGGNEEGGVIIQIIRISDIINTDFAHDVQRLFPNCQASNNRLAAFAIAAKDLYSAFVSL
jgi:hypothetical protein